MSLISFSLSLWSQQNGQPTVPLASGPDACLHRSIPLTIFRHSPHPTGEIKQAEVLINGTTFPSSFVGKYNRPIRVAVLIDTSGGMQETGGDSLSKIAILTAAFALDSAPANAKVAVGRFAELLQISQWMDRNSAGQQIMPLKYQPPKGKTALYSAVEQAAQTFGDAEFGDTIYLITDGGENLSAVNQSRLIQDLTSRGIRIFVFLVEAKQFKTPEEREGPQDMEELANQTGGFMFRLPWSKQWINGSEPSTLAKQIQLAAGLPYKVDFQLPGAINKSAKLKLETSLDPKLFTLAYPRHLEPCTTTPQP